MEVAIIVAHRSSAGARTVTCGARSSPNSVSCICSSRVKTRGAWQTDTGPRCSRSPIGCSIARKAGRPECGSRSASNGGASAGSVRRVAAATSMRCTPQTAPVRFLVTEVIGRAHGRSYCLSFWYGSVCCTELDGRALCNWYPGQPNAAADARRDRAIWALFVEVLRRAWRAPYAAPARFVSRGVAAAGCSWIGPAIGGAPCSVRPTLESRPAAPALRLLPRRVEDY